MWGLRALLALLALLTLLGVAPGCRRASEPVPVPDAATVALPAGFVVCEGQGGIWRIDLPGGGFRLIAPGGVWPRVSPEGTRMAFLRGGRICVADPQGGNGRELAAVREPRALAWHPAGTEVWYTEGEGLLAVAVADGTTREVLAGPRCYEIDVADAGRRLVATVKGIAGYRLQGWDFVDGRERSLGRGCSASLDPSGRLVTNNAGAHDRLELLDWDTGAVRRVLEAPAGMRVDNQFWSNHPAWIAGVSEEAVPRLVLMRVEDGASVVLDGPPGIDRPDFHVYGVDPG